MEDSQHPGIIPILTCDPFIHKNSVLFVRERMIRERMIRSSDDLGFFLIVLAHGLGQRAEEFGELRLRFGAGKFERFFPQGESPGGEFLEILQSTASQRVVDAKRIESGEFGQILVIDLIPVV